LRFPVGTEDCPRLTQIQTPRGARNWTRRVATWWPAREMIVGLCHGLDWSAKVVSPSVSEKKSIKRSDAGCVLNWEMVLPETRLHDGELVSPVESLERYFRNGGTSILRAAFEHSYFIHPDSVRGKTPLYPDRARLSREHYPKRDRGDLAMWQGREVKLGDNKKAQHAWERHAGRRIERGSGYGVRHVWGHPWDPNAFTAGWNLCYMPFWAGMLTERQHPHPELEMAVRQAAWDLYFGDDPVCDPPEFVTDPGVDLDAMLNGQPLLLLVEVIRPDIAAAQIA